VRLTLLDITIVGTAAVLMVALQLLVFKTPVGTAMRAVSYNMETSGLMGIPVDRIVSFTFVTGTALAAAAGFLYALRYQQVQQPAHATWVLLGLKAFVAAVVGGIGNIRGATVGGFLIATIEQFGVYLGQARLGQRLGVHRRVRVRAAHRRPTRETDRNIRLNRAGKGLSEHYPRTIKATNADASRDKFAAGTARYRVRFLGQLGPAAGDHRRRRAGDPLHHAAGRVVPERILIDMAIAMIAAVSQNIVNGFTGQFSIGHAAFMALGGYMAAWISYYVTLTIWKST